MVSIIVVTYNSLFYLKICIDSILKKTIIPYELIIIDNNSGDGSKEWLETAANNFKTGANRYQIILNDENKGYSGACNQGIERAEGDYLVFLNSDIMVSQAWLGRLISHLNKDPQAGLVGPMGMAIGGEQNYMGIYHDFVYADPGNGRLDRFAEQLFMRYRSDYTETKFLIGCCLLVKREVVDKVGPFDPSLFMSADDFDYSLRARMAGYRLYVAEDVFVHHYDHKSFRSLPQEQQERYINEGWQAFREKWADLLSRYTMDDLFYNNKRVFFNGLLRGRRAGLK